ncbi:hypothetical protein [Acidilobus sp.]|uniref:hypothetical protein n=1 Tax=Acidilobus sp. TaxID=1872109 RepID=UPI003D008A07
MSSLIDLLMAGFPVKPSNPPKLNNNSIELRLTESELKQLLFSRVDPKYQGLIDLKIENGAIVITFKLM